MYSTDILKSINPNDNKCKFEREALSPEGRPLLHSDEVYSIARRKQTLPNRVRYTLRAECMLPSVRSTMFTPSEAVSALRH